MIKLVVGLGNPGAKYEKTRHNAGFLFLDRLQNDCGDSWVSESRFEGFMSSIAIAGQKVFLLKPQTYMNKSGGSVGKVARYFKIEPSEILVVHDELDFVEGVVRLKKNGGHAGHNGLRDIIAHLGSKDFYRLRIGIGRPPASVPVADYVLSTPSISEMRSIQAGFDRVEVHLQCILSGDIALAMSDLHQ
jgi:peptidyl-tRNA hydrolase, PTH1 family